MVPDGAAAVVAFALLLAPGLLYEQFQQRHRPMVKRTALEEAGVVVLSSAVFTAIAAVVTSGAWWWAWAGYLADPGLPGTVRFYALAILTSAVACGLVALWSRWTARHRDRGRGVVSATAWFAAMHLAVPPNRTLVAHVRMKDGSWWRGYVAHYTAEDAGDGRDLVLRPPVNHGTSPEDEGTVRPDHWERVILNAGQIASIELAYVPRADRR